jgi:hypothetical protein
LEDFVVNVALPSLMIASRGIENPKFCVWKSQLNEMILLGKEKADSRIEAGARLTCHLLLRLFKTNETPQPALYSVGESLPLYAIPNI